MAVFHEQCVKLRIGFVPKPVCNLIIAKVTDFRTRTKRKLSAVHLNYLVIRTAELRIQITGSDNIVIPRRFVIIACDLNILQGKIAIGRNLDFAEPVTNDTVTGTINIHHMRNQGFIMETLIGI